MESGLMKKINKNMLFRRVVKLKIASSYFERDEQGDPVVDEEENTVRKTTYTRTLSNLTDDGKHIDPNALRIEFNVEKGFLYYASIGKFSIKNLNRETRYLLTTSDYTEITLYLGYLGTGVSKAFHGELITSFNKIDSRHTRTTNLTAISNQAFRNFSYLTATFRKGTSYYELADYISKHGSVPKNMELPEELKNYVLDKSYTIDGGVNETIQRLTRELGLTFDLDEMKVKKLSRVLEVGEELPVLNADSGIVDFPTIENNGVQFTSLYNPDIQISKHVKIKNEILSEEYKGNPFPNRKLGAWLDPNGIYFIIKLNINGNNKDGNFYCKGTALARSYADGMIMSMN